jgi:hypothetical protein
MSFFERDIQPASPEHQLDLLVDGEMSEADRRALLLQLEHEPDGWRRCALAFLEAQCWKAELGQIAPRAAREPSPAEAARPEPASSPSTSALGENRGWRQSWRQYAATMLTISASFLLALVVGMGLSGNLPHTPGSSVLTPTTADFPKSQADGLEMVTLSVGKSSDGHDQTVCVPAQRREALDQDLLQQIPDAIPPEMQQAFEQSGYRAVQQREIVPVPMKDGRCLVVPVDRVQIHYVGRSL